MQRTARSSKNNHNDPGKLPEYKTTPIDDLIPYVNNARVHSEEQIAQIAASIKEFGFINPVIVDGENGIVAGHGRVDAARKLGMEAVPTIEASHLSETQKRAYILTDNRLAENARWSDDLLKLELSDLKAADFDIELTGFDDGFLKDPDDSSNDSSEQEYDSIFEIVVECEDESDQEAIYKMMTSKGYKCRVLSM